MARRKRTQCWSYIAGKKGTNRVRAYEDGKGGPLYIEWLERTSDPRTGAEGKRRRRISLAAEGITTYSAAIRKAEEVAERFAQLGDPRGSDGPLTLRRLLDLYLKEVTPTKGAGTQKHDRICARMFLAFFGGGAIVERVEGNGRPKTELGRVRYHAWIRARRAGAIPGFPAKVGTATVLADLKFIRAVFRWATVERDDGTVLLLRNPWEGFPNPEPDRPTRAEMTRELHDSLVANAGNWRMAAVLELCRETRRRMNSVRQLRLEDVNLSLGTFRWAGEYDKVGLTSVTPMSDRAREIVLGIMERRLAEGMVGSPWLFPAMEDPSRAVPAPSLHAWMARTKKRLGIEVPRLGYHGEKRAGVRDPNFRALPAPVQEALTGTTWETLRKVYDYVDLPTLKDAVASLQAGTVPRPTLPEPARGLPKAA